MSKIPSLLVTIFFSEYDSIRIWIFMAQKKSFAFFCNDLMLDTVLISKLSKYCISFVLRNRFKQNFVFYSDSISFRIVTPSLFVSLLIKLVYKPRSCHTVIAFLRDLVMSALWLKQKTFLLIGAKLLNVFKKIVWNWEKFRFVSNICQKQSSGDVLQKKVFLKISQKSQEYTCAKVSFLIKLQA